MLNTGLPYEPRAEPTTQRAAAKNCYTCFGAAWHAVRILATATCGGRRLGPVALFKGREVISRQRPLLLRRRRWLVLAALLLMAACGQSGDPATPTLPADAWHAFEGTWTAAGTRRTLRLGADHRAAIFELTGSLLLTGAQRPAVGFKAQAIGFSDSRAGMQGRCVWTDERGDMVYSELRGEAVGSGNRIVGTFVGGTGRYAGVTGDYTFQWQYVVDAEDGAVSGRVVDLKGRARLGQAAPAPAGGPAR